jgi:general secretion pathway protein D
MLVSFFLLTQARGVEAVRVSEEEIVGKPATGPVPPVEEKKPVAPAKRPPTPVKAEEKKPVIPAKRPPAPVKAEEKKPVIPAKKPAVEKRPAIPVKAEAKPAPPAKPPPVKKEPEKRSVTIDFDNVDILLFVKFISEVTGKNFVIDQKVKGKVTIISPTKISVDEAYRVFESVLEVHGFTTVEAGNIIKIVPSVVARGKSIETRLREEAGAPEDKVVTQLIRLDYANPDELKKLFAPLISKSSIIVSYPPTGMLIVTDVLSNIQRLIRIISAIDVVGIGEEISVIPLEHAIASVLIKPLTTVFQTTGRRGQPTTRKKGAAAAAVAPAIKIVADDRTNALIVSASEYDTIRIKQLIKILDQETPRGTGNIRVHYLKYADAEELAKVLTALPSKETKAGEKGKAPAISKEAQIVADKATNSLVITANKQDYFALIDVINKLDIPRSMVFIEALAMEVTTRKAFGLGVEWRAADDIGTYEGREIGAFGASGSGNLLGTAATPVGVSLGVLGEEITIGGVSFPTIAAVVQAYQEDSDVHILQHPQIVTMDNEEAEMLVGSNIPFLSKESTGTEQQYATYEYKDVGVTLKFTPQINPEGFVRLKLSLKYETVAEAGTTPTTLKRTANTTVVVKDGHTVVIGGLLGEEISRGSTAVPCLGNIPLLGWLFKSYTSSADKTNLFVFLTPHVIENVTEADKIHEEKKGHIDKVQEGVIKMYEKPSPGAP